MRQRLRQGHLQGHRGLRHSCAVPAPALSCAWYTLWRLYCPVHVLQPPGRLLTRCIAAKSGGTASAMSTVFIAAKKRGRFRDVDSLYFMYFRPSMRTFQCIGWGNPTSPLPRPFETVSTGPRRTESSSEAWHNAHRRCGDLAHCFSQPPSLQAYMSNAISSWHLI